MNIALAQTYILWESKAENLYKVNILAERAKKMGADIIFFPEMSLTGFSMNVQLTAEYDQETVSHIQEVAKKNNIAIGIGWTKGTDHKAENHYSIINYKGVVISDYVKIHPFSFAHEDEYFQSGDKLQLFSFGGFIWSTFICFDLRFPEIFQLASEKADIIVVPANWPLKREDHWRTLLKARAIENQSYILGINCVGNIGGMRYSGCSMAVSPEGEIMKESKGKEDLLYITINNNVKDIRENFPVRRDRRKDEYNLAIDELYMR